MFSVADRSPTVVDRWVVFLCVVLFAMMSSVPRLAEFCMLALMAAIGAAYIRNMGKAYLKHSSIVIGALLLVSMCIYMAQDYKIDEYAFLAELKILTLFFVPGFFYHYVLLRRQQYQKDRVYLFYKYYVVAVFLFTLLGAVLGYERDTLVFGFSIYVAYSILYLTAYLLEEISGRMLVVAVGAIGLLGSVTAAMLMVLLIAWRYRRHRILGAILFILSLIAFYYYSLVFRGKDLLSTNFSHFDRYQIFMYMIGIIAAKFEFINYIFGWGIGRELPRGDPGDYAVISGWFLHEFTLEGIFSSSTHNEYLRLFIDYGPAGLFLVSYFLLESLPVLVIIVVAIAALTNTTLFSTSNILILSFIMADYRIRMERLQ